MSYSSQTTELHPDDDATRGQEAAPETEQQGNAPEGQEAPAGKAEEIPAWEQRRINAMTRKLHEAERRAALAEQREKDLLGRLPEGTIPQEELAKEELVQRFSSAVDAAAAKKQFDAECTTIYNKGMEELGNFDSRLRNFSQVGGLNPVLIEAVMESASGSGAPPAHKILFELGGNLDEAERILSLPPVRMAAAVAKFAAGLKEETRRVSNAPAPIKPITPAAAPAGKDPEKMNPQEWREWREGQLAARKKR